MSKQTEKTEKNRKQRGTHSAHVDEGEAGGGGCCSNKNPDLTKRAKRSFVCVCVCVSGRKPTDKKPARRHQYRATYESTS